MKNVYSGLKAIACALAFTAFSSVATAQSTVLINPATDGGFEMGTTFAANGFTEVNHIAHQWFIGPLGMATGTNGAYISMDGGLSNTYSNTNSQTSHFYRDVTVPAGQTIILLTLDLRNVGEAGWDRLLVYTAPTSVTPVAGIPASNTTAMAGATLVYTDPANQAAFSTRQIVLPASLAGTTFRLIFTWQNDASIGANPPASVDNISLVSSTPAPLNGVYTIDNTQVTSPTIPVPGNFNSFTDAITYLNLHGISGAVTFNVVAGQTFTESNRVVTATGTVAMPIIFQRNGVGANPVVMPTAGTGTLDIGLGITGGDYITFNGINVQENPTNTTTAMQLEYGYMVRNASATDGAQFNTITNCKVTMVRTNTASRGIMQTASTIGGGFTPSALTGSNASNTYTNDTVNNAYAGMYILGNTTFPDASVTVAGNVIGAATANDIGFGTVQSWGIRATNQNNIVINGNLVRNVTANTTVDGIFAETCLGTFSVSNNYVMAIRNGSATSTLVASGIRSSFNTVAGAHSMRIYNNMVSNVTSGYTGAATATRVIRGININTNGSIASTYNIHFNSVAIDGSSSPNCSSTAFEIATTTGPIANVRSNIFANFTGAQTGLAQHLTWMSPTAGSVGNTGSVSNYNDLYIADATNGFVGRGGATTYATLAAWQAATLQDANSVSADPNFLNISTNLHTYSVNVNGLADMTGITWITTDIDNATRNAPHDIGADEFTPPTIDMGVVNMQTPLTTGCYTASEAVMVRIQNYASLPIDFSVNNTTVTVNITGAITQTLIVTLTNNSLNAGNPLAPGGQLDIPMGSINMTTAGTYTFNSFTTVAGDGAPPNDAMAQVNILVSGGTYVASSGGDMCLGDNANLVVTGYNTGGTIQWQSSPDNIIWTNIPGATTTPYNVTPTDTTFYRAVICGIHTSTVDTLLPEYVSPAVTVGDTICGVGTVNLSASGSATLNWYDAPTGGNQVNTGTTYSPTISATDTFYVENMSGTPPTFHQTTYAAGNGSSGNVFTVKALNTITITSFDGHLSTVVGTPSTWEIWYRPNDYLLSPGSHLSNAGWTQLGTASTPSAGPGNPTVIPIPLSLQIPAGQTYSFQIFTTTGSVSYTNGTALGALYNANADLEFYQGHGGTAFAGMVNQPRVFNGRIHYSSGCGSTRTPVIAVVNTPPAVVATSSNNVCGSGSSTLVASSANPTYDYVWSPAGTLNTPNGDTVIASPTANTYYLVTASDPVSGCVDTASVLVLHAIAPAINATVSDDTICANTATLLDVVPTFTNPAIIGTGTIQNTSTSYPAPYGQFYWGSRHQMLILASELTAAGMTAGYINALSFDIVNTNAAANLDNFEIKIGATAATAITTFQAPTFTSVFYSPSYAPVTGINTHTFSTPFYWDGMSNIIVETCHNNAAYTTNCSMNQSATAFNSTVYYRADAAGVCGNAAVTGFNMQRPNMQLWRSAAWDYSWTPIASLDNPALQSPTATPGISTMYNVAVTDSANGCVSTDSVFVFVNPNPPVNFGPDTSICSNATLLLDGTAGSFSYLWQDNSTNQTFTVSTFGTYHVAVTDSGTGCFGTDTILVGIDAAPSFTLGSDVTVCQGTQVSFSGPSGQYAYLWNTADTTVSVTTGTAGSYDLAVTDTVNGCSSMDTVVLSVNPVPAVSLGNDTNICSANGSITLSGPAGNYEYQWSTMDSSMSIVVSSTGNYFVVVTDTATSCSAGDTVFITYNISPVANLGNDTTFCSANGPITLMGPSGSYTYVWNDMSTGMTLNAGATGLYYVDVLDTVSGCTTTDSIMVTVPASPSFTLSDTSVCGTQYTINGPAGPYVYDWSTLDSTQSITVSASGNYSLTVTDTTSGCAGNDASTVTINANPTVTATASANTVCIDDANVMLTGTPAGGTFTGTSVTGNQFDPSVGVGNFPIVYNYTDGNGCSGTASVSVQVNACVGITDPVTGAGMNVYPNPNTGQFTFFAADMNCAEMTIELTTIEGQTIYSNQYSNVQGNFTQEINMAEFANGVYFMRVTTDGAVYTQRVVKQE